MIARRSSLLPVLHCSSVVALALSNPLPVIYCRMIRKSLAWTLLPWRTPPTVILSISCFMTGLLTREHSWRLVRLIGGWLNFHWKAREAWAWWAFAVSGTAGFLSFLAYLGYGYLDIWHAAATLFLLPLFALGLSRTRANFLGTLRFRDAWSGISKVESFVAKSGRLCIGACGAGLTLAGLTIIGVGMTVVFVPQELTFMGMSRAQIQVISPMLIPVIAHDRAGFGGGLLSAGLLIVLIARNAPITRSFVEVVAIMGACGFGAAPGCACGIGYLDLTHLAPAVAGLLLLAVGLLLCAMALAQKTRKRSTWVEQTQSAAFK